MANAANLADLTLPIDCQERLDLIARPIGLKKYILSRFDEEYFLPKINLKKLNLIETITSAEIVGGNTVEGRVYSAGRDQKLFVKFSRYNWSAIEESKLFILLNSFGLGAKFVGISKDAGRIGIVTEYVQGFNTKAPERAKIKYIYRSVLEDILMADARLIQLNIEAHDLQFLITNDGRHAVLIDPQQFVVVPRYFNLSARGPHSDRGLAIIESLKRSFQIMP